MKRPLLLLPLLALALPAPADETSETILSVDYANAAFTNVLADVGAKVEAANPEDPFRFKLRLDRSVTNELPTVTLRADDIALGDLLSKLDALTGLSHVEDVGGYRFVPPPRPLPPPRTLKDAIERFRSHAYRTKGETLRPYAVRTVVGADGGTSWLFTCESSRWTVGNPFQDAESDEEATERTETVVLRVDSSGQVDERSREPAEELPFPPLWLPSALNYCRAAGIDPDSLSSIAADAGTNMVFVSGTNAPIRVPLAELPRAEKACFFRTIAEADRIVVRDGGFDCCTPVEAIDRQRVLAVVTNAAEIAAFTAMIRFEDGPGGGQCMCCGYPGVDWWKGGERIALTAVQHGRALRWGAFSDDYPFTEESAKALARWFEDHGVRPEEPRPPATPEPSPAP